MKKVIKKLARIGDQLAIPLDKSVIDELGIDKNTPVEVSVRGQSILVSPEVKSK